MVSARFTRSSWSAIWFPYLGRAPAAPWRRNRLHLADILEWGNFDRLLGDMRMPLQAFDQLCVAYFGVAVTAQRDAADGVLVRPAEAVCRIADKLELHFSPCGKPSKSVQN
jgi:hypothetical protein